jgi:hypothetical protein
MTRSTVGAALVVGSTFFSKPRICPGALRGQLRVSLARPTYGAFRRHRAHGHSVRQLRLNRFL